MLINSPNISGSLTVTGNAVITGSLTVAGGINGAITGSATSASYVEYSNVANKPALVSGSSQVTYSGLTGVPSGIVSGSSQITYSGISSIPSGIVSGSSQVTYSGLTGVPSGIVSSSTQIEGYSIFATTGSNQFNGSQAVTGSLTVTGQVVAQTLNVQQVTSSIVYSSGSNIFGNTLGNTQQFTGSLQVTGSTHYLLGNVGIGTNSPQSNLQVLGTIKVATGNAQGILGLGEANGTTVNVGLWRGAANAPTTDGNFLNLGGYEGIVFASSNAAIGSQTERMRITSGGNVGIGTASPVVLLQVSPATTINLVTSLFTAGNSDGNFKAGFANGSGTAVASEHAKVGMWYGTSGNPITHIGFLRGNSADSLGMTFNVNNSEYMRINSSGNVGIGTTDLGPNGLSLVPTFNYSWSEGSGNAYAVLFRQLNSGATVVASGYKRSSTGGFASSYGTSMARAAMAVGYNNGSIAFFSDTATNVVNGTDIAPTERLTILNTGNVGIGTTSPGVKLVNSGATLASAPTLGSGTIGANAILSANGLYGLYTGVASEGWVWQQVQRNDGNTSVYSLALQPSGGNVGIGTTSPNTKLQVEDGYISTYHNINANSAGYGILFYTNGGGSKNTIAEIGISQDGTARTGNMIFTTSNAGAPTERMRITSGGNVGIGTTNPSQKLHLIGGNLQTAGNSSYYRNIFEIDVTTYSNVVSFTPQSSTQYTAGFINITASGYVNGGLGTGVVTSKWSYTISNNVISIGVVGSDIIVGSAPSVRLIVSSNVIYVQVQSYNTAGISYTTVYVESFLGSGYIGSTSWAIS